MDLIDENNKKEPSNDLESKIQKLRLYKGLENLTDEEAENALTVIRQLTDLAFEKFYKKIKKAG